MEYTEVERKVLEQILAKPLEDIEILRRQLAASTVTKRDLTGVGFYTTISVPHSEPALPVKDWRYREELCAGGHVKSDPEEVLLFLLWLHEGYLGCLEGYTTLRHSWPQDQEIEVFPVGFRPA